MKPRFFHPECFHAELDGNKKTERSFLFRRHQYRVTIDHGFCFKDRDGQLWVPTKKVYHSDGASIPHPFDWVIPPLDSLKYRMATMGIHDPAYRHGTLDTWVEAECCWMTVKVSKNKADSLLQQGIEAEGGWPTTRFLYWFFPGAGHAFM